MPNDAGDMHIQCAEGDGECAASERLIIVCWRGSIGRALVWRVIAGLGHRSQIRVAQRHLNLPELPFFIAIMGLVGQCVILRSQQLRTLDLGVNVRSGCRRACPGLIHKHAKVDVFCERVAAVIISAAASAALIDTGDLPDRFTKWPIFKPG